MLVHSSDVGERQSNRRPDLVPPSVAVQMIFKFRNFLVSTGKDSANYPLIKYDAETCRAIHAVISQTNPTEHSP